MASERQIKGWSRKKKEALIKGDWEEIARLAKSKSWFDKPVLSPDEGLTTNGE